MLVLLQRGGMGMKEGFVQVEPTLVVDSGAEFGLNVGAPVWLRLWGGNASRGLVRREDWDSLSDCGQLVRGPQWGSDNSPVGVWLGVLEWALALWGLESLPAAAVRRRVSPWDVVGPGSAGRWDALCRWAGEARRGTLLCCVRPAPADWTARAVAARAATTVAAFALPATGPPSLSACSFRGAERAR